MSALQSILVATDFSKDAANAVQRAALLAREHDANLRLMHVVQSDLLSDLRALVSASDETHQRLLDHAGQLLDAEAERVQAVANRIPERDIRSGDVLDEILAAADHSDLLVLGARGQRPVQDLMIGTTAERLLRKSRRPMLVVNREPSTFYQKVLVPVDFSVHSIAALQFARQIAPQARLLIFHAYECPYEGRMRQSGITEDVIQQLRAEIREQALSNMQGFLDKASIPPAQAGTLLEAGNPKFLIAATASQHDADLIVIGKHGRTAMGEFFLGGVTRHTLSRAKCDVAVVPDRPRL